jgi:hypothetical protein
MLLTKSPIYEKNELIQNTEEDEEEFLDFKHYRETEEETIFIQEIAKILKECSLKDLIDIHLLFALIFKKTRFKKVYGEVILCDCWLHEINSRILANELHKNDVAKNLQRYFEDLLEFNRIANEDTWKKWNSHEED